MVGVADPRESWSVARFTEEADACVQDILHRGKRPVLVGGTGLYLDSLVRGGDFAPGRSGGAVRERLQRELAERGAPAMLECLREVDPESAARLHLRDEKRILRALEVYEETGETITAHNRRTQERPPRYDALYIGLDFADRADLRARIDRRVDEMVRQGLLQEVETLLSSGVPRDATALQAIGYRQFLAVRDGAATAADAIGGGQAPLPPVRQAPADVAAPERGHPLDPLGKRTGFPGGSPECDRISHRPWLRIEPGGHDCASSAPKDRKDADDYAKEKQSSGDLSHPRPEGERPGDDVPYQRLSAARDRHGVRLLHGRARL